LVAAFPPHGPGFELGSIHVGSVVDRAVLGQATSDGHSGTGTDYLWWTERHRDRLSLVDRAAQTYRDTDMTGAESTETFIQ
jgi:hypothetical protein